ncbi:MAG: ferric reductase-like transmembrane domain-containing protein [Verrucomicrobia bacterium]|nr:ferric reductase-like transmembrane domain-containing protein [Verrucomicrobiota bacterium]
MSLAYRAVDWNRQKRRYDLTLLGFLLLSLGTYIGVTLWVSPLVTAETLIIRGTSLTAILLLHVILSIGPLARLDPRFLPLLYNRRHLGVTLFVLALIHGVFSLIQFQALGDENPLVGVFTGYRDDYRLWSQGRVTLSQFPFEPFGVFALGVFFLLAATSHDFWLRQLGPSLWKTLHLGVYVAYGLVLAHVALGVLQSERSGIYPLALAFGFVVVASLHVLAARKEVKPDNTAGEFPTEGWTEACAVNEVSEGRGRVVTVNGQRIALFRHLDRIFATSNVCRHQGGPLGEGRIVEGCITCPWHGWNYQPEDGCSPPPFQEVVETYETRVTAGRVWIRSQANPLGTRCEGARADAAIPDLKS